MSDSHHQSCNDSAVRDGIAHLHEEIEMLTSGSVDIDDYRYQCPEPVAAEIERLRHQVRNHDDALSQAVRDFITVFQGRHYGRMPDEVAVALENMKCLVAGKKSPARVNCGKCDHPMGCETECRIKAASDSQSAIGKKS